MSSARLKESASFAALRELFTSRIAILDGAMGSMIQTYKLTEADFRGDRFAAHPHDLKGNNDLLCLTRPEIIEEIHGRYFAAGTDISQFTSFADGRDGVAYERRLDALADRLEAVRVPIDELGQTGDFRRREDGSIVGIGCTDRDVVAQRSVK